MSVGRVLAGLAGLVFAAGHGMASGWKHHGGGHGRRIRRARVGGEHLEGRDQLRTPELHERHEQVRLDAGVERES